MVLPHKMWRLVPSTEDGHSLYAALAACITGSTARHAPEVLGEPPARGDRRGPTVATMRATLLQELARLALEEEQCEAFSQRWGLPLAQYIALQQGAHEGADGSLPTLHAFTRLYRCAVDVYVPSGSEQVAVYRVLPGPDDSLDVGRTHRVAWSADSGWHAVEHASVQYVETPPEVREFELTEEERALKQRSAEEVAQEEEAAREAALEVEERTKSRSPAASGDSPAATKPRLLGKID